MANSQNSPQTGQEEAPTSEELKKEQEALAKVQDEELKEKVEQKYGVSEYDDPDSFKRFFELEKEHRRELSEAIGQKIKYREKAQKQAEIPQKSEGTPQEPPQKKEGEGKGLSAEEADKLLDLKLDERELLKLDLADEAKDKIRAYAKGNGIPLSEAMKSDYAIYVMEQDEQAKREIESSAPPSRGTPSAPKSRGKGGDEDSMPEFDVSTEEGIKQFEDWKKKNLFTKK